MIPEFRVGNEGGDRYAGAIDIKEILDTLGTGGIIGDQLGMLNKCSMLIWVHKHNY